MAYNKLSFLKGLALGLAGKPLEFAPGEPVERTYEWLLSKSIVTTDGEEANERISYLSNIDDEILLVCTSTKKLYRSYDGMVWEHVADIPFSAEIIRVNGVYYSTNSLYYSDDLVTWTACTLPSGHPVSTLNSYQYTNGKFWFTSAYSDDGTYLYYSDDGKSWTAKRLSYDSSGITSTTWWGNFSIHYFEEAGLWLGNAARTNALYYSTDGISWHHALNYIESTPKYHDGVFTVISKNNSASPMYRKLYKSTDGKSWTEVFHEDIDDGKSYTSLGTTFLNHVWYLSSMFSGLCYRSLDNCETFEQIYPISLVQYSKYAFGKYWIGSNDAIVSADGENWEAVPDNKIMSAICTDDLALYRATHWSEDGINWHETNIGQMQQNMAENHSISSISPIKFKGVFVSYYRKYSGTIINSKSYECRLLYMPCHDILNEDGTIYLAASDPVPVNPIDKASFLQGYVAGRRLAGMRSVSTNGEPVAYLYNGVQHAAVARVG